MQKAGSPRAGLGMKAVVVKIQMFPNTPPFPLSGWSCQKVFLAMVKGMSQNTHYATLTGLILAFLMVFQSISVRFLCRITR